jgi:hypothetical protein
MVTGVSLALFRGGTRVFFGGISLSIVKRSHGRGDADSADSKGMRQNLASFARIRCFWLS